MAVTTPQKVRAIKPKPSEKKSTKKNLLEQLHVVRMWEAHVERYRDSLQDDNATPSITDFEKAHGLPRQFIRRHVEKKGRIEQMPSESAAQRYNVREGVRPFYPVELVLKKAINTIRNRYLLPVDQALVQTMAQEIYDLLRTRLGPLSFEKPRFTNGWMANF